MKKAFLFIAECIFDWMKERYNDYIVNFNRNGF